MNKNNFLKDQISNLEAFYLLKSFNINEFYINKLLIKLNNFKDNVELTLNFNNELKNKNVFDKFIKKIEEKYPIEYILGEVEFYNLYLKVNEDVLIPRQETEELVDTIIKILEKSNFQEGNIIDVCSGSGCIGLSLKKSFKESEVYLVDISKKALEISKENAKNNDIDALFIESDKLDKILTLDIKFDVLLSNPPYVENKEEIDDSVLKYEPSNAVYNENPIDFYENYFINAYKIMKNDFIMGFEIDPNLKDRLISLIEEHFNKDIKYQFKEDFFKRIRFLYIIKGNKYDFL